MSHERNPIPLKCDGTPLLTGDTVALNSQIPPVDHGGIIDVNIFPLLAQDVTNACQHASQIVHPPACDTNIVQNNDFNNGQMIGPDINDATKLAWINRFSDPVVIIGSSTANLQTYRTFGQNVILIQNGGVSGDVLLTNPPTGCEEKHLWIKNISTVAETVTSADLIDGQGTITLDGTVVAGYPFGNNGGEGVHLVWSRANNTWYVI